MTLKELIRQVAERGEANGPRELAEQVAKTASTKQIREFFIAAILDDCRQYLMGQRNSALNSVRQSNRSARLDRQSAWWTNFLATQAHISDGEWKALGDCTVADLKLVIEQSKTNIARIRVHMDQYECLAALLQSHNVTHVRDLPPEVVQNGLAA